MKKYYALILMILSLGVSVIATGCTTTDADKQSVQGTQTEESENAEDSADLSEDESIKEITADVPLTKLTVEEQIQLILSKRNQWQVLEETDTWGYAVTDLNQNGRLELISSECHGTGFYSTNRIFEVNEAGDDLLEYQNNYNEGDSQPDFTFNEEYQAFYIDGSYRLLIEDMIKDGAADYHYFRHLVSFENGIWNSSVMGHRSESYRSAGEDTEQIVTFFDEDNLSISEEEYNSLIDKAFAEAPRYQVKIGWSGAFRLEELREKEIKDFLLFSFEAFEYISADSESDTMASNETPAKICIVGPDADVVEAFFAEAEDETAPVTLTQTHKVYNNISTQEDWLEAYDLQIPVSYMVSPFSDGKLNTADYPDISWDDRTFYDENYIYMELNDGTTPYGMNVYIFDRKTKDLMCCVGEFADQWSWRVNYAKVKDDILYIGRVNNGYASPNSSYLTAYDLKEEKLLWRSEDQTYNSGSFVMLGDVILCGYGFTDEKDYLYQIDAKTGKVIAKTELAKMADYILEKDGKLYVHTYSYDYIFEVE